MAEGKILVIDDDKASLELVTSYLIKHGYQVYTVENGTEAVTIYEQQKPEIVLLDIVMPGVDGFVTLRKLRSLGNEKFPRIIMLTAKGGTEDIMRAIKLGANDYLVKPITEDRLLAKLKRQLANISVVS